MAKIAVLFAALSIFGVVSSSGRGHASPQCTALSAGWRSVSLPFRPICIASEGNALWVGGVDEMLAKSEDGGQTWKVKHQKIDGEVLLAVGTLGEKVVYASGTNGEMLWSSDDGDTWKSWEAGSQRVDDVVFTDALHGIRRTLSRVQITEDGGNRWSDVSVTKTDDSGSPFS